jgi:uncharacterized protein
MDIVFEKDLPAMMRDDVAVYVDIFRSVGALKVPAVVAWSPYDAIDIAFAACSAPAS